VNRVGGDSSRLEKLKGMLEKSPGDTFLLYAMALEYRKIGDAKRAMEFLEKVIQHDWGFCYAYHQKGLTMESMGDMEGAKAAYRQGIDAAARKGDRHAGEEIAAALAMIE
jgi:tetratricopeptide (TPR) repeat protein